MRRHRGLVTAGALCGFLLVVGIRNAPPGQVGVRVSDKARLAGLIRAEQDRTLRLRAGVGALRARIAEIEQREAGQRGVVAETGAALDEARRVAGLLRMEGPALEVEIDDSPDREPPTGNLSDLVIHSQDVQAIANGLWVAGAEALAVNGERVVPTSALLCVGNTLLINGTVHSPPYHFTALGEPEELRRRFLADDLVQRFRDDADRFHLGFSVASSDHAAVPPFRGSIDVRYARRA